MTLKPFQMHPRRGATRRITLLSRYTKWRWTGVGLLGLVSVMLGIGDPPPAHHFEPQDTRTHVVYVAGIGVDPSGFLRAQADITRATPAPRPVWMEEIVQPGDNLSLIFSRAGYNDRDVYAVSQADGGQALRRIFPGEKIAFLDDAQGLAAVRHVKSKLRSTTFERTQQGFLSSVEVAEPEVRRVEKVLTIDSSLFLAGQEAGVSAAVLIELAQIFGGVIDFALDPRTGDQIELLYEALYLDNEKVGVGNIVAAAYTNRGETHQAYRFTDARGDTGYFNEAGVSLQKAFLKAPLDFRRVSDNFNPRRLHPIFKTVRPHRGVDYAADRGTPVYAAGDGKVIKAGRTRPNGNYVFIQHGERYRTHYLHLNKLKTRTGARVKQGDLIGTVGATGYATAPHLHYEFLIDGVHRNPRTVHKVLPKAKSLPRDEMGRFTAAIQQPAEQLANLRSDSQLAMVN